MMKKGDPTGATYLVEMMFGVKDAFLMRCDKSKAFGERFTDKVGRTWELVGQNDLHVPYFCKVKNNKVQKTRYCLILGEEIAQRLLEEKEQRDEI